MFKRFLCVAAAAVLMFSLAGCGKAQEPVLRELTEEYAKSYVLSLASYENRKVFVEKDVLDDRTVEEYADFYYRKLAESVEGLTDEEGNIVPLNDESVEKLGSEVFKTEKEFMLFSRETVKGYIEEKYKRQVADEVLKEVVAESSFSEPDAGILEGQKQYVFEDYSKIASEYDMDVETYVKYLGTSVDKLCEDYAGLQAVCILIAGEQGIDTSDRDTMFSEVADYIFSVTKTE